MENEKAFLPEISKKDIENAKDDAWKFIHVFLDKYLDMSDLNEHQHTLAAYMYLDSEVYNGGFIQLIQNGYGGYIFDTPFSEYIKSWGAEKMARIVDKAKETYIKHKKELEEEKDAEGFCELYKEITDFEPLEDEFYQINDEETEKIKEYVEKNINNFAKII